MSQIVYRYPVDTGKGFFGSTYNRFLFFHHILACLGLIWYNEGNTGSFAHSTAGKRKHRQYSGKIERKRGIVYAVHQLCVAD